MKRWTRRLAPFALGLTLTMGTIPHPVLAQEDPNATGEGKSEGRPWDGYVATGALVFLAMFLVAKSARR